MPQRRGFTHIDGDGERTITVIGKRIVPHGEDPLPWELLSEIDGVYFTGGDPGALRAARRAGALVATPRADATLLSAGVRLDALASLVETPGCRRAVLLRHFGEDPPAACGNCDNCLDAPSVIDATELARKLLSAVYRTGQSFGFGHVQKVLTGADDERVRQRGHDKLGVFGIVFWSLRESFRRRSGGVSFR